MVEKQNDALKRKDLDLILEVNKKAIEIETEVAEQNEEIIKALDTIQDSQGDLDKKLDAHDEKLDKLIKQTDETNKDLFRMQVLFVTGLITLVAQIVEIFLKK
jgi:hypothetical protein